MSSPSVDKLPVVGFLNVNSSCWWNSVLQIVIHNPYLRQAISQGNGPLHTHLQRLIHFIKVHDTHQTYETYTQLLRHFVSLNPIFRVSSQNDAQEVLLFLLNALHEEHHHVIPSDQVERMTDVVSKTVARNYQAKTSPTLYSTLSCLLRKTSDGQELCETYTILYIEPKKNSNGLYTIQASLDDLRFAHVPRCLFLSILFHETTQCQLSGRIKINQHVFKIHSIIFFLSHGSHYVATVQAYATNHPVVQEGWIVFNDNTVFDCTADELSQRVNGYPSVICYVMDPNIT